MPTESMEFEAALQIKDSNDNREEDLPKATDVEKSIRDNTDGRLEVPTLFWSMCILQMMLISKLHSFERLV